jgi:hypothetical protein
MIYSNKEANLLIFVFFISVMKDPESDIVDVQSLLVLTTSPSYVLLLKEVHKLSWIDVDVLLSDEDKICFFTNVLNVLLCQAAITELAKCSSTTGTRPQDPSVEDQNSEDDSWEKMLPRLDFSYCRISYLKKYGYIIGNLGFVRYEISTTSHCLVCHRFFAVKNLNCSFFFLVPPGALVCTLNHLNF